MDFVRRFASCTPQSASVVAGLACALIMMEVQRMPVAHSVSFSMFAPAPYLAEAFALMVLAFLVWRYPARRLSNSAILRGAVGFLATLSTWLVLWGDGARRDAHVCGSRGLPGFYGAACSAVGRAAHGTWFVARGVSYCCCDHSFRGAYLPAFGCSGQCAGGHSRAASSCGCRGLSDISGPTGRRRFLGASLNLAGRASSASRFFS